MPKNKNIKPDTILAAFYLIRAKQHTTEDSDSVHKAQSHLRHKLFAVADTKSEEDQAIAQEIVVGIAQPYLNAENNGTPIRDVIASIKAGKTVTLKDPKQEPTQTSMGF